MKDSNPFFRICFKDDGSCLYAANTDNMKVYNLEANSVLDIVMKPHRKILDLKCGDDHIYVADHTNKSVIVSGVDEGLINYEDDVQISKTVTNEGGNVFKQASFYKKNSNDGSDGYGGKQGTAKFGRGSSRQRRDSGMKKSVLATNALNLLRHSSTKDYNKDPYTGTKYDFNDFNDEPYSSRPPIHKHSPSQVAMSAASPPTISSYEVTEIINKLTNNHSKVLQLFKSRKSQLWNLQQHWTSGNTLKALKYLHQAQDSSLTKDFMSYTF